MRKAKTTLQMTRLLDTFCQNKQSYNLITICGPLKTATEQKKPRKFEAFLILNLS